MRNLILIGGGGHCKSVIDVAELAGFNILGVLDVADKIGEPVLSTKVIGSDDDIDKYIDQAQFIISVGSITDTSLRIKIYNKIKNAGGKLATIISPTAYVSKYAKIGEGSVIMHQVVVNAECEIGNNCIINTMANIDHESTIDDFTHISTGSMINGACHIGKSVFIGSQSVVAQGVTITDKSIISAGSFIHKHIKNEGIYAGNPIRKIR